MAALARSPKCVETSSGDARHAKPRARQYHSNKKKTLSGSGRTSHKYFPQTFDGLFLATWYTSLVIRNLHASVTSGKVPISVSYSRDALARIPTALLCEQRSSEKRGIALLGPDAAVCRTTSHLHRRQAFGS